MNRLYETLEICLNEIEQGAGVDAVLLRYPAHADELRPILETSMQAKTMAVPEPSEEVVQRNRAKLLQHAAQMRESKIAPVSRRIWSAPLRRALITLMMVTLLFVSGTGLVRASSKTLPGDDLYSVKRTWENLLVFFTFDVDERDTLELEHENERLEELRELIAQGRSAKVDFAGDVTRQNGTEWRVSGITVIISPETRLPAQQVGVGAAVRVRGQVQGSSVAAAQIELLPPGSRLPEVEDDELEIEEEEHEEADQEIEDGSDTGPKVEATAIPKSKTLTPTFEPENVSVEGNVASIQNIFIVVNGILMNIQFAEIKGIPGVGVIAKAEGYYDASGVFIVTKIEFKDGGSNSNGSNPSGVANDNTNRNSNNNDNDVDDDNDNDNDNDNKNNNDD